MNEDAIFSSVPTEILNEAILLEDKNKILELLKAKKGQFLKAREIAELCDIPAKATQIAVRYAITKLIEVDSEPIVANSKGFSYAERTEQLISYVDALEQRKMGLERRINKIRQIYMKNNEFEVL